MGAAYFYHLTRGWRCVVVGRDAGHLAALDQALWNGKPVDFLAHGLAGGAQDADQPILLAESHAVQNNPACAMCIDGADISAEQVKTYERTCILFDGNDAHALQAARGQWKALTDAGCAAQYWSEESGNWQMKAKKD